MNFYVILIIAVCLTLDGVNAASLKKSDEYSVEKILTSKYNDKRKLIDFDAEMHDSWLDTLKQLATFFGYTGAPTSNFKDRLTAWPHARIPYEISDDFDDSQQEIILKAIDEFHQYTCVRFVPRWNEEAFIEIIQGPEGCLSSVGYSGSSYKVHLQSPGCGENMGSIMHELMHLVGFVHEQSRHDRDNYVTIQWANIKPGREVNFNKFEDEDINDFGFSYDFGSLMHYPEDAFSNNGGKTIIPKVHVDIPIGQRDGFSENDVLRINEMYQCR